jgi:hypothetical protein
MTEVHVLTKGCLTRLRNLDTAHCHLRGCGKAFALGERVVKVGKHYYCEKCGDLLYFDSEFDGEEVEA